MRVHQIVHLCTPYKYIQVVSNHLRQVVGTNCTKCQSKSGGINQRKCTKRLETPNPDNSLETEGGNNMTSCIRKWRVLDRGSPVPHFLAWRKKRQERQQSGLKPRLLFQTEFFHQGHMQPLRMEGVCFEHHYYHCHPPRSDFRRLHCGYGRQTGHYLSCKSLIRSVYYLAGADLDSIIRYCWRYGRFLPRISGWHLCWKRKLWDYLRKIEGKKGVRHFAELRIGRRLSWILRSGSRVSRSRGHERRRDHWM